MTRIGFAYNQKPDHVAAESAAELARADEEPPSSGTATATLIASAPAADDEYAEWDSLATIDAVFDALSRFGEVIRLEATDDFPVRLRDTRPDIVFLAGHFSANAALAADFKTAMTTSDLTAAPLDMTNVIVLSIGCHSGYNIVDGPPSRTSPSRSTGPRRSPARR